MLRKGSGAHCRIHVHEMLRVNRKRSGSDKMKKLTFFIAYEQNPYAGTLRPFLNWSKSLINEYEINFILFKCGNKLRGVVGNISENVFETNNLQRAVQYLKNEKIDWIIGDDYYPRLKLLTILKTSLNCNTAIYVQVLYGFNSISRISSYSNLPFKSKILLKGSSLVPFKLLTNSYVSYLKKHDLVIPNSKNVRLILQMIYGIMPEFPVYPPVDIDLYKDNLLEKSPNDVLIYLGSNAGDTNGNFIGSIVELLVTKKYRVNIFGNAELMRQLTTKFERVVGHSNVSNEEIVDLYSKSILTVCPQKFEMFGYVPVESMACGTPVLAFDMMGPSETIIEGKTGWLAKSESCFLDKLEWLLNRKMLSSINDEKLRYHVMELCSNEASVGSLTKIICSGKRN